MSNLPIPRLFLQAAYGLADMPLASRRSSRAQVKTDLSKGSASGLIQEVDRGTASSPGSLVFRQWKLGSDGSQTETELLAVDFDAAISSGGKMAEVGVADIRVNGRSVPLSDFATPVALQALVKQLSEAVSAGNAPDIKALFEQAGLLPTLLDEEPAAPAVSTLPAESDGSLDLPKPIAAALLGLQSLDAPQSERRVATNTETGDLFGTTAQLRNTRGGQILSIGHEALAGGAQGRQERMLAVRLGAEKNGRVRLGALDFLDERIDPKDRKTALRVLSATRQMNRELAAGTVPDGIEAVRRNRLSNFVNRIPPPPPLAKGGRFCIRQHGGNNTQNFLADEAKIGGNGMAAYHEGLREDGTLDRQSLVIDSGIMFADKDATGQDGVFPNQSAHFRHRSDPEHEPESECLGVLITHGHEDHIGALVHYLKAGYILPPIHCTPLTARYIRDSFKALQIPQEDWPEIKKINPYETLEIGCFKIETGPISHSFPGIAFDIQTPSGSLLAPGDYKLDQEIQSGLPTDIAWLKSRKVTALVGDSTSAPSPGYTDSEATITANLQALLERFPDKRPIVSIIGSNASRLMGTLQAGGQTGRDITVDGAAVDRMRRALNVEGINPQVQEKRSAGNLTAYMKRFGTKLTLRTSDLGEAILEGRHPAEKSMILATGTQDEMLSTIHRLARGEHPRIKPNPDNDLVIISQRVIPGNEKRYQNAIDLLAQRGFTVVYPKDKGYHIRGPGVDEVVKDTPIHASGHPHEDEVKDFVRYVDPQYVIPIHGDPDQLARNAEVIKDAGYDSHLITNQDYVEIRDGKPPQRLGQLEEEWIYVKHIRPPGQFWGGEVEYSNYVAPPVLQKLDSFHLLMGTKAAAGNGSFTRDGSTKRATRKPDQTAIADPGGDDPPPPPEKPQRRRRYAQALG